MKRSDLIDIIAREFDSLPQKDVELAVHCMLNHISESLASGERIEILGFGSFSLHYQAPRQRRNPKTGESVALQGKYRPHFKPGFVSEGTVAMLGLLCEDWGKTAGCFHYLNRRDAVKERKGQLVQ